MTRREFTRQIAFEYAMFELEMKQRHGDVSLQPLDQRFACSTGSSYIESGQYETRAFRSGKFIYLDWARVARESRKHLPRVFRDLAEFGYE